MRNFLLILLLVWETSTAWSGPYAAAGGVDGARVDTLQVWVPWRAEYGVSGMSYSRFMGLRPAVQLAWAFQCKLPYGELVDVLSWSPTFVTVVEEVGSGGDPAHSGCNNYWVMGIPSTAGYSRAYVVDDSKVYYVKSTELDYGQTAFYSVCSQLGIGFSMAEGHGCFYREGSFTDAYFAGVIARTVRSAEAFMLDVRKQFDFQEAPEGLSFSDVFGQVPTATSVVDWSYLMCGSLPSLDVWRSGTAPTAQGRSVGYSGEVARYSGNSLSEFLWLRYSPLVRQRPTGVSWNVPESVQTGLSSPGSGLESKVGVDPQFTIVANAELGWQGGTVDPNNARPLEGRFALTVKDAQTAAFTNSFFLGDARVPWMWTDRVGDSLYSGKVRPAIPFKPLSFFTELGDSTASMEQDGGRSSGVSGQFRYGMFPISCLGFADFMNSLSVRLPVGRYPKFVAAGAFRDGVPDALVEPPLNSSMPASLPVQVPAISYYGKVAGAKSLGDIVELCVEEQLSGVEVTTTSVDGSVQAVVMGAEFQRTMRQVFGTLDYGGVHYVTLDLFVLQNGVLIANGVDRALPIGISLRYSSSSGTPLLLHSGATFGYPAAFPIVDGVGLKVPRSYYTRPFRLSVISDSTVYCRGSIGVSSDATFQEYVPDSDLAGSIPEDSRDSVIWYVPVEVTDEARQKGYVSLRYNAQVPGVVGSGGDPEYFMIDWQDFYETQNFSIGRNRTTGSTGGFWMRSGPNMVWVTARNGSLPSHIPASAFSSRGGVAGSAGTAAFSVAVEFYAPVLSSVKRIVVAAPAPFSAVLDSVPASGAVGRALDTPSRTLVNGASYYAPIVESRLQIVAPDFVVVPRNFGGYW